MTPIGPSDVRTTEVIHGVVVQDPYRWLEDPASPATRQWIRQRQVECDSYFKDCTAMGPLRSRVKSLLDVEIVDQPCRINSRYFFRRRRKAEEQACIYLRDETTGDDRLLVAPSSEGPFTSVDIYRISEDGAFLAYGVGHGGGDRREIRVVEVDSGTHRLDILAAGYRRGLTFAANNEGFYYVHEINPAQSDHEIRYRSFSSPDTDRIVFSRPRSPGSALTLIADEVHLGAIWVVQGETRRICNLYVAPRISDNAWRTVYENRSAPYVPTVHRGRVFVVTYESKANGELVELLNSWQHKRTIVPESQYQLQQIAFTGNTVLVGYAGATGPILEAWTLDGEHLPEQAFPQEGTIRLLPQLAGGARTFFFTHETFRQPAAIHEYSPEVPEVSMWYRATIPCPIKDLSSVHTSIRSSDGAAIPISVISGSRGSELPSKPLIMTTYGGFGIPSTPRFSVLVTVMLELGAAVAISHIRGGGEHGKAWHDAARGSRRQSSIDDFISAAEWLCREGFTSPEKLAIFGGSHSGLLVGAAVTQRPELFRATVCIAPLLDMVRYELFDRAVRWRSEYGTVADLDEFHALHAYSPYHRVQDGVNYPAMLFVTGDQDDRCNPAHVRKTAARLQERTCQSNPILVDYSSERGHAPVLPLSVRIDALTRRIPFLCRELHIEIPYEVSDDTTDF